MSLSPSSPGGKQQLVVRGLYGEESLVAGLIA